MAEWASAMKAFEASTPSILSPESYVLVRADGHHFSKYTKGFKKPFDDRIKRVMVLCTVRACQEFNACCGYVCSDEITLLFVRPATTNAEDSKSQGRGGGGGEKGDGHSAAAAVAAASKQSDKKISSEGQTQPAQGQRSHTGGKRKLKGQAVPLAYPFGGRAQKIASLVAGFLSTHFNFLMQKEEFALPSEQQLKDRLAWFDARCVAFPTRVRHIQ